MFNFSVIEAKYIDEYKIWLRFYDNKEGEVDLKDHLVGEIFEPLKSVTYFKNFYLKSNTISWSNGADFAPEFLYELARTD